MKCRIVCLVILLRMGGIGVAQQVDQLYRIEADPVAGFNFPCYLYLPAECSPLFQVTLLVEPNNTGFGSDDFAVHDSAAQVQAMRGPLGHFLAEQLRMPLLVPVFPRPQQEWHLYTHMLDRDVMKMKKGVLKRPDLQLLAMINAAREKLFELGYAADQQIVMTGYSSSGVFANRFAVLHPLWVKGYAAGGINGMMMMPYDEIEKTKLCYPLGTADFEQIRQEQFDLNAFQKVAQFLYMGALDTNDAVLFDDGYSDRERHQVFRFLGEDMMPDRWQRAQQLYTAAQLRVTFRTYEGLGHQIDNDVRRDLVTFFRQVLSTQKEQ
jgi:hypothetical protein